MTALTSGKSSKKSSISNGTYWPYMVPGLIAFTLIVIVSFVWNIYLSFTKWNGFQLSGIQWVGTKNYVDIATIYPAFWPAIRHNLIWLVFLFVLPTVLGMFLAVILDREMWGSRFYQTAFYLPVVLSLALVGFIGSVSVARFRVSDQ